MELPGSLPLNRGSSMRFVAQPTHTGKWWVLDKVGHRIVVKDVSEAEARASADAKNALTQKRA